MSNTIRRVVIAGAFLVLLPAAVLAVPQAINYQGRLTDGAGVPVTGDRPVVFSLYTTSGGGTALWTEGRTVTVTDGAFSVELGSLTPIPSDLFLEDSLYLGVTVDTDPEMTPRQRITSTGYAFEAAHAVTADSAAEAAYALEAAEAAHAVSADGAINAANASEASHALGADTATTADYASQAGYADTVDSMHAADIINAAADEVRVPIDSVPFTISAPGSYYFTGDLTYTPATGNAITVSADDVTIDLMGYSLAGPSSGGCYGIYMSGRSNVEIRNGTIRNFGEICIYDDDTAGLGHRVVNIRASSNGYGIYLMGSVSLVKDCTASGNSNYGVYVGDGSTITGNTVYGNGIAGIHCGKGSTVSGNTVYGNGTGIEGNTGCTIDGNTVYYNQQTGIFGYDGSTITGNTVYGNNRVSLDIYAGIRISSYCLVKGNSVSGNNKYNIFVGNSRNSLEDNLTTNALAYGIYFGYSDNFYSGNRSSGNSFGNFGGVPPTAGDGGGNMSL